MLSVDYRCAFWSVIASGTMAAYAPGRRRRNTRRDQAAFELRCVAARLILLCHTPLNTLDRESGPATFLGDLAVLLRDEAARRLVALETAEDLIWHAAVGAH